MSKGKRGTYWVNCNRCNGETYIIVGSSLVVCPRCNGSGGKEKRVPKDKEK